MMEFFQKDIQVILASNSPRRQHLLKEAGINFFVKSKNLEEIYPPYLIREQVPIFLSKLKADAFLPELDVQLLIAADTIVYLNGEILGKPNDKKEAIEILRKLSGRMHEVITGVTLLYLGKSESFFESTQVFFSQLSESMIEKYVDHCKPFDKAGSYGIQESIGILGIEKINGCFYNVMGLPVNSLIRHLNKIVL